MAGINWKEHPQSLNLLSTLCSLSWPNGIRTTLSLSETWFKSRICFKCRRSQEEHWIQSCCYIPPYPKQARQGSWSHQYEVALCGSSFQNKLPMEKNHGKARLRESKIEINQQQNFSDAQSTHAEKFTPFPSYFQK